jgi:hypothetical protein
MRLHHLIAATTVLWAAGCTKDFNDTIACGSDLNCPTGYHCGSSGKCQTGEAPVTVQWVSPADGTLMHGAQSFSVKVSHPDGVSSVTLMAGSTQVAVVNTPADTGKGGLVQVDLTGVNTALAPDGNTTLSAVGTSTKGASGNAPRAFHLDNHETTPAFTVSNPPTPTNSNATTFVLKGTADVSANLAPSNVYIFTDNTCGGGNIAGALASGTASSFVEPGFILPVVFDSATSYFAMAVDSLGNVSACSAGFTFINDRVESTPFFASGAVASGNRSTGPFLVGTASTNLSPSTVSIFAAPDCTGTPVASGPATSFVTTGIQVPLVPNATTVYTAQSTDIFGNVSACSNTVPNGTVASTNAQFCADGPALTGAQLFSPLMQGCAGKVTFDNRATQCAAGCRTATAEEWVANSGGTAPTHHYWTDDNLFWSNFTTRPCGPGGCGTNNCFASRGTNASVLTACPGVPMHVCAGTGAADFADPDGNTCTWTACGYNSITPKRFFGGCSGAFDATAGTLCVCGIKQWFVSNAGDDANTGNSAASPFKTITKALSVASPGETVFVAPGTYNTASGETFPVNVSGGVNLIGDEPNRGAPPAGGTATTIMGSVVVFAGATLAGFTVTNNAQVSYGGPNGTVRNNTMTGNGGFAISVTGAVNHLTTMNTSANNTTGWGLFSSNAASGKIENNIFSKNRFGIELDAPAGDLGGGAAGSAGNNLFCGNSETDLWMVASIAVNASNNRWDHVPPTTNAGDVRGGLDYFTQTGANVAGNTASINSNAALAACPP